MAHILVIEDDTNLRGIICSFLVDAGHEVTEACDGLEAEVLVEENVPDLVLTDIIMPQKDGIQTIIDLHQKHPHLQIIGMSGGGTYGPEHYLDKAKELGACRTLTKPFGKETLLRTIDEVLIPMETSGSEWCGR